MSETLYEVTIDLAKQLASIRANMSHTYSSEEFLRLKQKFFAEYTERINIADQKQTCKPYYNDMSHWTDAGYEYDGEWLCSVCKTLLTEYENALDEWAADGCVGELPFAYCPHCGTKVVND